MAEKSDVWMALYIGVYLADTMHLARQHHGSYLLMIMAAFKNAGWLPNDDGLLAQIAKCTSREWKAEKAIYASFFQVTDERWTHKRVTIEWDKAQAITAERSSAGSKGAAKRWQSHRQSDGRAMAEPSVSHRQNDAPSQTHTQTPVTTTLPVTAIGRAHELPEGWQPSEDDIRAVKVGRPDLTDPQIAAETERFCNHARANARTAHNWGPNWRNWMIKAPVAAPDRETWDQRRIREGREALLKA